MKVLLSIIISTIGALGNLTFVLVIVIYIFAVIGMQLFAKDYTPDKFYPDPVPRYHNFYSLIGDFVNFLCVSFLYRQMELYRFLSFVHDDLSDIVRRMDRTVVGLHESGKYGRTGHLFGHLLTDTGYGQFHGTQFVLGLVT